MARARLLTRLPAVAAVLAIAAGLTYAFWPEPVLVDVATVTRGDLEVIVAGEGKTRVKEVYVVSAPIAGRLGRIDFHVGDAVRAGETVLAEIRPAQPAFLDVRSAAQAEARVRAAEAEKKLADAELEMARAELDFAKSELARAEVLAARKNVSARALELAGVEVRRKTAQVETYRARIAAADFELQSARAALMQPGNPDDRAGECCVSVIAPASGRILRLIQEDEAVVESGMPLVEIGDPHDLEIVVDLLSTDAVKIAPSADAVIDHWGGARPLAGRVRLVEPYGFTKLSSLGVEEQRVNVIIDLSEPAEAWASLGHGFRVEARVVVWRGEGRVLVPVSALFREQGRWSVYAIVDGRARLRHVEVGHRSEDLAEVVQGLDPGTPVIVYPGNRVSEGIGVVPRPE